MTGFPPETFAFVTGLSEHNEKVWFDANRPLYEAGYVEAGKAFVAEIGPKLRAISPTVQFEAKINGSVARTINGNRTPVFALAASLKGNYVAYGGADKTVTVVDGASGNRRHTLKECADVVYCLAISPDGATLAAGARDGKVRLWNLSDGTMIMEL